MEKESNKSRFRIERHPPTGSHPVWRLLDGDTLVVTCSYLKGAEALIEYIVNYDTQIKDLQRALTTNKVPDRLR